MSLYTVVLCIHLFGAFTLVSGMVLAGASSEMALREKTGAGIAALLGMARVGALILIAGAIIAAGCGLWLVYLGHWGYGTPWIASAITVLTIILILGAFGGHRPKKARLLAAATDGPPSNQLYTLLSDPVTLFLNYTSATALAGIIVYMVAKP